MCVTMKIGKNISGIEDKLVNTNGYHTLITAEGCQFFKDIKKKDTKHESDISMLNQFFDSQGDR